MEKLEIVGIKPGRARKDSSTPDRKFLQVFLAPKASDPETLNSKAHASRNVWEGYKGERLEGGELNIKADPLYISICSAAGITETTPWEIESFNAVIGLKVNGEVITEFVEPYEIPGSLSADARRVQYTLAIFEGENKYSVFKAQNHPIVTDPVRRTQLDKLASEIAFRNEVAKNRRTAERGMPLPSERKGTGALIDEQQYDAPKGGGKHLEP